MLIPFPDLLAAGKYIITIPTRNPASPAAVALSKNPSIRIIKANYETEAGMRSAFAGQDAAYFVLNAFAISEPHMYFWTFRGYEIAVQSGLKWFLMAGGSSKLRQHKYEEKYRNSHNTSQEYLSEWLSGRDTSILPWTIVSGGVYAEMLGSVLLPRQREDGVFEFVAPIGDGSIPLMPLDDYGVRTSWILEHPEETVGKSVSCAPYVTTYPELAKAFESVTGKRAVFRDVTQDQRFQGMSQYVDPEGRLPEGASPDDPTSTTFRESFGKWWNLWKYNIRDLEREKELLENAKKIDPDRADGIEGWVRKVGYTGELRFPTSLDTNSS